MRYSPGWSYLSEVRGAGRGPRPSPAPPRAWCGGAAGGTERNTSHHSCPKRRIRTDSDPAQTAKSNKPLLSELLSFSVPTPQLLETSTRPMRPEDRSSSTRLPALWQREQHVILDKRSEHPLIDSHARRIVAHEPSGMQYQGNWCTVS